MALRRGTVGLTSWDVSRVRFPAVTDIVFCECIHEDEAAA